jgi:hypothetical protein
MLVIILCDNSHLQNQQYSGAMLFKTNNKRNKEATGAVMFSMTNFHPRDFSSTLNYCVTSSSVGYVLTENEEQWTLSIPTKLLLQMKGCFSSSLSLLCTVTLMSLVSSQSQIEEGTRSRAACGAAIRIVLAVFVVRAGFRDRLGRRMGYWALQTVGLTSLPST